jgi:hypothetical protein
MGGFEVVRDACSGPAWDSWWWHEEELYRREGIPMEMWCALADPPGA